MLKFVALSREENNQECTPKGSCVIENTQSCSRVKALNCAQYNLLLRASIPPMTKLTLECRNVEPKEGARWWLDSWNLISSHIIFSLGMGIFFLAAELLGQIPLAGAIGEGFLISLFGIGSMAIFADWDKKEKPGFSKFFIAFYDFALFKRLLPFTGAIVGLGLLAELILFFEQLYSNPDVLTKHTFKLSLLPISLCFYLVAAFVYAIYFTVLQFSLPLMFFADASVKETLILLWKAGKKNWQALLVNLVVGAALLGLAALPMGLGLVAFFPMMLAIPYVTYKGLFNAQ